MVYNIFGKFCRCQLNVRVGVVWCGLLWVPHINIKVMSLRDTVQREYCEKLCDSTLFGTLMCRWYIQCSTATLVCTEVCGRCFIRTSTREGKSSWFLCKSCSWPWKESKKVYHTHTHLSLKAGHVNTNTSCYQPSSCGLDHWSLSFLQYGPIYETITY
jgi:hypothetical protein